MKTTRLHVSEMLNGLMAVKKLAGDNKYAYAVARNIDRMLSIQKITERRRFPDPDERSLEYFTKIEKLKKDIAEKTVAGDFETLANDIEKDYQDVKQRYEAHFKTFQEYVNEDVEIDIYMLKSEHLPDNITPEQMQGLMFMVDEPK
jgi:hypothetical protein